MVGKCKLVVFVLLLVVLGLNAGNVQADEIKVCIGQIVEHPALDASRQGFLDVLKENGFIPGENLVVDYQNAQNDMTIAHNIAKKFAWEDPDLVLAIATPMAQAIANNVKDTPILITAVTDPVAAGIIDSMEKPGGNVTGTTDMTPVVKQIDLLLKLKPSTQKIGMIYNAGETNSVVQVELARKVCKEKGLTLLEATADNTSMVYQAAQSLGNKVDALYIATDNTVSSAVESVVKVAEENKIPLVVGEEALVERGGLATEGISYYELGRQTGKMALKIMQEGKDPALMPIESQQETRLVLNETAAKKMGVSITEALLEKAVKVYK